MKKLRKYFPIAYVAFLIFAFFFVKDVINDDMIRVEETEETQKKVEEIKPVDITLFIDGLSQNVSYELRKENDETFDDMLEDLVNKEILSYEKTEYIYGTVYDKINGEIAPEDYLWKVYLNDHEITFKTKGVKLEDEAVYKLKLEKKSD